MKHPLIPKLAAVAPPTIMRAWTSCLMLCLVATPLGAAPPAPYERVSTRLLEPLLVAPKSAAQINEHCERRLQGMLSLRLKLEQMPRSTPTVTLVQAYDDFYTLFTSIANTDLYLVQETHPVEAIRAAAGACIERSSGPAAAATMSRPIFEHLKRIEAAPILPSWKFMVRRQLEIYRRSGVELSEEQRARIAAVQEAIVASAAEFQKNIREGVRFIMARPEELAGLPQDYLASHPAGPDGLVKITSSGADTQPVFRYATSSDFRKKVMIASLSRGFPENDPVLKRIFAQRQELASLLGYKSYAAFDLANRMVRDPASAQRFLDAIAAAARPAAARDAGKMLARLRRDDPSVRELRAWDSAFAVGLIQKEEFDVDQTVVRKYLAYPKVKDGILRLAEDLFGVQIRPWKTDVWAPQVEAFEVVENGEVLGRFYLDMHPRSGKNTHASMFPLREGSREHALPVAALVMNQPNGLLEHSQVRTFLHEFGHLLHWTFAGKVEWSAQNFYELENDVIETPSQLLEEWAFDYATLSRFATDEAGTPIPRELVAKMNASRRFGEGFSTMNQLGYAAAALTYYSQDMSAADLSSIFVRTHGRYAMGKLPQGVHPQASFTHLSGYGPSYYSYQWSKGLAVDLLSEFRKNGLRDLATARRYRTTILAPGGSESMNVLARRFLGRRWSPAAYRQELESTTPAVPRQ
jgi:thimet oligopeptidase